MITWNAKARRLNSIQTNYFLNKISHLKKKKKSKKDLQSRPQHNGKKMTFLSENDLSSPVMNNHVHTLYSPGERDLHNARKKTQKIPTSTAIFVSDTTLC